MVSSAALPHKVHLVQQKAGGHFRGDSILQACRQAGTQKPLNQFLDAKQETKLLGHCIII